MGASAGRRPGQLRWILLTAAAALVVAGAALFLHDAAPAEAPPAGPPASEVPATAPPLPQPMPEPQASAPVALLPEAGLPTDLDSEEILGQGVAVSVSGTTRYVEAIVVAADGTPVPDASVEAFVSDEFDRVELFSRISKSGQPSAEDVQRLMDLDRDTEDATWLEPVGRWTSGTDGSAQLEIPSCAMLLVATHAEQGTSGAVMLEPGQQGGEPNWVRLELSPRSTVTGLVLDSSGAPVPGAHVDFSHGHMPDDRARPRLPRPLDADAEGRFSIEVDTPFFAVVHARLDDGRQTVKEYVHARPGSPGEVELRFPGGFAVTGVVLDAEGRPHPSATIDVAGFEVHAEAVETRTDGSFRLTLSKPGHVVLVAKAEGLLTADVVTATVSEEVPVADVVIRMIEPATISGRVEWTDGTPIGDVTLFAHLSMPDFESKPTAAVLERFASLSRDGMAFRFELNDHAESRGDGSFRFESIHPDVTYDLTCYGNAGLDGAVRVKDVKPGATDVVITFEKDAGSSSLRGTVIDAETRAPVPRCTMSCSMWRFGHALPFAQHDAEVDEATGRFQVDGLQPGQEYGLVVEAIGYPETTFGPFEASDEQLELALGRHGGLLVEVVDESGAPQSHAVVQLAPGEMRGFGAIFAGLETSSAGADGRAEWPKLKPGKYTVEAVADDRRAPRQSAVVEAGGRSFVRLVVGPATGTGRLEVRVLTKEGSPRAGAEVKLVRYLGNEDERQQLEPIHLGHTDADGRFLQQGLEPGQYIVSVESDGTMIPLRQIDVIPDALAQVTVTGGK